ncbi:hypothetical protein H9X57_04860 [Flavobacterium piscinae]|uniref:hypothetical protein n=1 Tax=Flavobacterium piscinae TaxID=2506424 RepID=UPI001996BB9C|nr:hypothetical protein [Flavobacterium piscinae]MBC8882957.1 hypothetical protein [Flavobacterium piscinae]
MNELIEKYFENTLSAEEKVTWEENLKNDPEFKKEVEFQLEIKNAVLLAERQKIKNEIKQFELENFKPVFQLRKYFPYLLQFLWPLFHYSFIFLIKINQHKACMLNTMTLIQIPKFQIREMHIKKIRLLNKLLWPMI